MLGVLRTPCGRSAGAINLLWKNGSVRLRSFGAAASAGNCCRFGAILLPSLFSFFDVLGSVTWQNKFQKLILTIICEKQFDL
jgi:hypothetical protein